MNDIILHFYVVIKIQGQYERYIKIYLAMCGPLCYTHNMVKTIYVKECDKQTWEQAKTQAREKRISMSEYIIRALFNEYHENLRRKEIRQKK